MTLDHDNRPERRLNPRISRCVDAALDAEPFASADHIAERLNKPEDVVLPRLTDEMV
jgi:hypothetical protein